MFALALFGVTATAVAAGWSFGLHFRSAALAILLAFVVALIAQAALFTLFFAFLAHAPLSPDDWTMVDLVVLDLVVVGATVFLRRLLRVSAQ